MKPTTKFAKIYTDCEWTILIFDTGETWDIYYSYKTYDLKHMFGLLSNDEITNVEEIVENNLPEYKVNYLEDLLKNIEEI